MKIIILGAAGFIGTNLTLQLLKNDKHQLILADRNKDFFSKNVLDNYHDSVNIIETDINENTDFDKLLDGQEMVYHLASTTVPSTSNQSIPQELSANIVVTAMLLDACVRKNVKRIVFLSSGGTVYGKNISCPIGEEIPLLPISTYGIQKATIEKLLSMYEYMYGLDYRIIRLSNPFGQYQKPNGVQGAVTTFVYNAINHKPITIYGDGSIVRDYLYIEDAVRGIIRIADGESIYKVFNLGSGVGTSLNQLIALIENALGCHLKLEYKPGRKVDVPTNYLDVSRYKSIYGPICSYSIEQGIQKTAEFLRSMSK